MFYRKTSFAVTTIIFFVVSACSLGGKTAMGPMKVKLLNVQDGEFLKYSTYVNGERTSAFNLVTRFYREKKTATIYIQDIDIHSYKAIPSHYTNYGYQMKIDLEKGSLIESDWNSYRELVRTKKKGLAKWNLKIDTGEKPTIYKETVWNETDMHMSESRISIRPGFPIWNMDSTPFGAARFLDITGNGILYEVIPHLKTAIPGKFIFTGRETLETPAGKFNTIKVSFSIADPFLAKLLEKYTKEMYFWIEDSDQGRIIKAQNPWAVYILDEISIWK